MLGLLQLRRARPVRLLPRAGPGAQCRTVRVALNPESCRLASPQEEPLSFLTCRLCPALLNSPLPPPAPGFGPYPLKTPSSFLAQALLRFTASISSSRTPLQGQFPCDAMKDLATEQWFFSFAFPSPRNVTHSFPLKGAGGCAL